MLGLSLGEEKVSASKLKTLGLIAEHAYSILAARQIPYKGDKITLV